MTHSLEGHYSVEQSARQIRNYRYAAERMTRLLGGWLALTPEVSAKLLMGRHVWDNAQHADLFGRRLPELRAPAQVSEPSGPAFVAFMEALESPDTPELTVERLVGVYRVLKPHLLAAYEQHLGAANAVYEPPTCRILARCIEDERRHVAAGETVLGHLLAADGLHDRAVAWQRRLEDLLAAAGGVTGEGLPPVAPRSAVPEGEGSAEAREFIRLETAGSPWALPDDLRAAVQAFGDALVSGEAGALDRWIPPSARSGQAMDPALAGVRLSDHRVVAVARLGAKRIVKLRAGGPSVSVTLVLRWMPGPDGWRLESIDLARAHVASPA